jgi:hypothetical protein
MPRRSEEQNYESGILSTYNAAELCGVAPITFRKWCVAGSVVGAFQNPGSAEWKISAPDMLNFLNSKRMPVMVKLYDAVKSYRNIYNRDGSENKSELKETKKKPAKKKS